MAISKWATQVKKQPEGDEAATPSPAKVLCTSFEKAIKKMEGNLTLVKDCSHGFCFHFHLYISYHT